MIKALLFDLDNTLTDRNGAVEKYMHQWLRKNFPEMPYQQMEAELKKIMAIDSWGYSCRDLFCEWIKANYPGDFTPKSFLDEYLAEVPLYLKPCPQISGLVQELANHYLTGILTNGGSCTQRMKLEATGLQNAFARERIFISAELGYDKPLPQAYAAVLDTLQMAPEEVLMIGDDPINDVAGARKSGLKTCWVSYDRPYPAEYPRPDFTVVTINELINIAGQW